MTARPVALTDDERAVIDSLMHDPMMRDVVAGRPQGSDNIRTSHRSGGDAFTTITWCEKGAIVRRWYDPTPRTFHDTCPAYCGKPGYQPVERMHVDGRHVASWNRTEPVRVARVTHRRLIAWAEALTDGERRALLDEPRPEPVYAEDGGLFDLPDGYVDEHAAPELTRGEKRARTVENRILSGQHPLGYGGRYLPLHPDAPRTVDRAAPGPRCGTCAHREIQSYHNKTYPKCMFGDGIRVTGCESSDVRAWWPACRDYEEAAA